MKQAIIDLYKFYNNCYKNEYFSNAYGRNFKILGEIDYSENALRLDHEYKYIFYLEDAMLNFIKETFIMYLGYHSIERVKKTITTSELNIYETFYNYLLNDFTIFKMPKMMYDEKEKKYIRYPVDHYYLSSKEQILKQEIDSIKKMVKLNDRYKYYRS